MREMMQEPGRAPISPDASQVFDCDVLVVGGSLVGLAAAVFLADQGLNVVLAERHESTTVHPKARGVNTRSMELYRAAGFEDVIRRTGEDLSGSAIGPSLASESLEITVGPASSRRSRLSPTATYICEQDQLEPILRAQAAERGARLLFGCTAANVEQHESGVTADLQWRPSDEHQAVSDRPAPPNRVTARYVVAADGARSPLREAAGIGRHGEPVPGTGLSVVFDADLQPALRGRAIKTLIVPDEGAMLFTRAGARSAHRLALFPRAEFDYLDDEALTARAIPIIRTLAGIPDLEITVSSAMSWRTGAYVSDRYRDGRIFFVGDAAHLMPPYGGFGGNTGIADAHNLAWKLAAVCSGEASAALLDTYQTERQPLAEFTVKHVMARGAAGLGNALSENAFDPNPIVLGFRYPGEQAQGYDAANPVEDPAAPSGGPGTRTPHISLRGPVTSTLDLLDPRTFTFIAPEASEYASALRAEPLHGVGLRTLARAEVADTATWDSLFPNSESAGILVRPDGVICWRSQYTHPDPRLAVQVGRSIGLGLTPDGAS